MVGAKAAQAGLERKDARTGTDLFEIFSLWLCGLVCRLPILTTEARRHRDRTQERGWSRTTQPGYPLLTAPLKEKRPGQARSLPVNQLSVQRYGQLGPEQSLKNALPLYGNVTQFWPSATTGGVNTRVQVIGELRLVACSRYHVAHVTGQQMTILLPEIVTVSVGGESEICQVTTCVQTVLRPQPPVAV